MEAFEKDVGGGVGRTASSSAQASLEPKLRNGFPWDGHILGKGLGHTTIVLSMDFLPQDFPDFISEVPAPRNLLSPT